MQGHTLGDECVMCALIVFYRRDAETQRCFYSKQYKMDVTEYIKYLKGFNESLKRRGIQTMLAPAAQKLYARIKSRTKGGKDSAGKDGYYGGEVKKGQTFTNATNAKRPVNKSPANNGQAAEP